MVKQITKKKIQSRLVKNKQKKNITKTNRKTNKTKKVVKSFYKTKKIQHGKGLGSWVRRKLTRRTGHASLHTQPRTLLLRKKATKRNPIEAILNNKEYKQKYKELKVLEPLLLLILKHLTNNNTEELSDANKELFKNLVQNYLDTYGDNIKEYTTRNKDKYYTIKHIYLPKTMSIYHTLYTTEIVENINMNNVDVNVYKFIYNNVDVNPKIIELTATEQHNKNTSKSDKELIPTTNVYDDVILRNITSINILVVHSNKIIHKLNESTKEIIKELYKSLQLIEIIKYIDKENSNFTDIYDKIKIIPYIKNINFNDINEFILFINSVIYNFLLIIIELFNVSYTCREHSIDKYVVTVANKGDTNIISILLGQLATKPAMLLDNLIKNINYDELLYNTEQVVNIQKQFTNFTVDDNTGESTGESIGESTGKSRKEKRRAQLEKERQRQDSKLSCNASYRNDTSTKISDRYNTLLKTLESNKHKLFTTNQLTYPEDSPVTSYWFDFINRSNISFNPTLNNPYISYRNLNHDDSTSVKDTNKPNTGPVSVNNDKNHKPGTVTFKNNLEQVTEV